MLSHHRVLERFKLLFPPIWITLAIKETAFIPEYLKLKITEDLVFRSEILQDFFSRVKLHNSGFQPYLKVKNSL